MTTRGAVAQRLIRERADHRGEGPSHIFHGNQHTGSLGPAGSKAGGHGGGHHHGGSSASPTMSDAMEMLGDGTDPAVDLVGDSLIAPTELQVADLEQFVEAHADLWARDGSHLVATIDPKTGKVVATVAKLTAPSASSANPSGRSMPDPAPYLIETASMNRRSGMFPKHWGEVPREPEVRHKWILQNCRVDADGDVSALIELRARYLLLSIRARRFGPGE